MKIMLRMFSWKNLKKHHVVNTPHWNWVRLPSVQAKVYTLLAYIRTITQYFRETWCWVLCIMETLFRKQLPIVPSSQPIQLQLVLLVGDAKTKKCGVLLRQRIHFRHHANWQRYCNDGTFPSQLICDFSLTPSSLGVSCRFPKKVCRRFSLSIYVIKSLRIVQRFTL